MRKLRLVLLTALLAMPIIGTAATPAHACTSQYEPNVCDVVNRVCQKVAGGNCLG